MRLDRHDHLVTIARFKVSTADAICAKEYFIHFILESERINYVVLVR